MADLPPNSLIDALPLLAVVTDEDGGNARLNRRWNVYSDDTTGIEWQDLIHPEDRRRFADEWQRTLRSGDVLSLRCRLRRRDGAFLWHQCRVERVRDPADQGVVWFVSFVDDDDRPTEHHDEAWLASIVDASDDAIVGKTLDGIIRSWNAGAERIFGYSSAEAVGQPITLIVPPERYDEERSILQRLHGGERIDHFETERVAKDGRRVDVSLTISPIRDGRGRIVGASKVSRDITERKRTAKEIESSRAELRLVTDSAAVLLAHCDVTCRYLFVNRAYTERLGLRPADVVGRRIPEIIGEESFRKLSPYIDRVRNGEAVEFEVELPYPALGPRFVQCTYVPDVDEAGNVQGFVAAILDVSERKHLEAELSESDRRKDEFLAVLSHELRNPLAPLTSGVELLARPGIQDEQLRELSEMMSRQLAHLKRLVDDLLDVSRISRGQMELQLEPFDLSDALSRAIELSRSLIDERKLELKVETCQRTLWVCGDLHRIVQVLAVLLNNAAKFNRSGGAITATASQQGDSAAVHIRDSGYGIPPEHLDSLFDMFGQVPEHGHLTDPDRGLGIGLALAKQIVVLHHGSIEVHSEGLGRGSEFIIRLPRIERSGGEAATAEKEAGKHAPGSRRVLVVDDNVDAADALSALLVQAGHDVKATYHPSAALEAVAAFSPDIVLLDIGLPDMDGYEVAQRVRSMPGGNLLYLCAVTGWGKQADKRKAAAAGFDAHLTKPIAFDQLQAVLAQGTDQRPGITPEG